MALKMHPSIYSHPGGWMKRNYLDHYGISVTEMAEHIGVSRQNMSALLNGRTGLSAEMAIRFEKAFGVKADTLLRMQTAYELARARAHEDEIKVDRLEMAA